MASTISEHSVAGSKHAAISNLIVRTMSEYTGRGPTKARTHIHDDVVTVMLQDTLTKGERSLANEGHEELVLTMRKAFQRTMREEMVSGVEEILGRKVLAFFSDNSIDPDCAAEVFLLAPATTDAGRRMNGAMPKPDPG